MNTSKLPCTMSYTTIGESECVLEFKSNTEGIATTYANLYRRVLLQSIPRMAVAGIRCISDENIVTNLFQPIDGLRSSLIDVNQVLHNTVFNIDTDSDIVIISMSVNSNKPLYASDLCNADNYTVRVGDVRDINLVSKDSLIASIVGNHMLGIDIYFKNDIGFSQKDVNKMVLENEIGESSASEWIVTDSQHRGVSTIQYDSEVQLGRQVVTLRVHSYSNDIKSIIDRCSENILEQINSFKLEL